MKKECKQCPFCGNPGVEIVVYPADGMLRFRNKYAVQCNYTKDGCGAEGGWRHDPQKAVDVWNHRKRKWKE